MKNFFKNLKNQLSGNLKILKNIGWLFADKFFRMGIGLVVGVWVARYLGPQNYGLLSYSQAYVALFSVIATLGLDGIVVRDIVQKKSTINSLLGTTFGLKLIGGIVLFFIAVFTSYAIDTNKETTYLIAIISVGNIIQSFDTIDLWFQSRVQSKYTVLSKNVAFLLVSLGKVICILSNANIFIFAILGVIEIFIGAVGMIWSYRLNKENMKNWNFSICLAKDLLKKSWPLILSGFVITLYMKIDQVMLKQLLNDEAVGIYTVGIKISEIWYFIPMCISTSIVPKLLEIRKKSMIDYERSLQRMFSIFVAIAYLITIIVGLSAHYIIDFLYGMVYRDAAWVLIIHIWAAVFVFLGVLRNQWLLNEDFIIFGLYSTAIGAVINVLLNLWLIPEYTYFGAAVATVMSQFVSAYFSGLFYYKVRKIFVMQTKSLFLFSLFGENKGRHET